MVLEPRAAVARAEMDEHPAHVAEGRRQGIVKGGRPDLTRVVWGATLVEMSNKAIGDKPAPFWIVVGFTAYLGSRLYHPLPMTETLDHWSPYISRDTFTAAVVHERHAEYGFSTTVTATVSSEALLGVTT